MIRTVKPGIRVPLVALVLLGLASAACDRISAGRVGASASVRIQPPTATVPTGGTVDFTATVSGSDASGVTWSVDPGGGTIDSAGHYTAPSAAGTYHVIATSTDGTASGVAVVTVTFTDGGGGGGPTYAPPADRATVWKPGVTYNGGIPVRTTVCATIDAGSLGNGAQNATATIQAAIRACPEGQVVQLSAGTFTVNDLIQLNRSVTLRGAGAGATLLQKTNGAVMLSASAIEAEPVVVVGPNRWPKTDDTTSKNLAADGLKGATSVTLTDATGFAAGQFVVLDELSGASWQTDPLGRGNIWAAPDWRVTWQLHDPPAPTDDPLVASTPTGGDAAGWFCRRDRPTSEYKEIASVSGNVVTFTSPLHISYRTANTAQLTRHTGGDVHVKGAGLEGVTVTGGGDGAVRFEAAAYSWARNVEVTQWLGEGFAANRSFRVEIRDSYVHDGVWSQPGGAGYAISLAFGSAEVLVENNISMMANKVMVARSSGAGSVFGYNYVDDGFILYTEGWIEAGLNASHMVGPHHVLFEGNYGFNFDSDKTHGSSSYHTVFRNWLRGVRRPFVNPMTGDTVDDVAQRNLPRRCAGSAAYSYNMTFVGNVLGAAGEMGGWIYDATGTGGMSRAAIWLLGWDDWSPNPYDPNVAATAIRDGNWDWVQAKQSWDGTPGDLPDSLYMPGKPAFFGSQPWPWVDPTTGAVGLLPAKARFDAGHPNDTTPP